MHCVWFLADSFVNTTNFCAVNGATTEFILGLPSASAYALARTFLERDITIAAHYSIVYGIKTLFCLKFKSSAKGTSISKLQNI